MIYILQKDTPTKKAGTKFIYEPRTGGMYYAENDDNIGYHSDIIEHEKEWFIPESNNEFYYCQSEIEDKERCRSQCDHCKNYYAPLEKEASIHESANNFIRKATAMLVEAEKQYFTDRKNAGIQLGKMFIEKAESLLNKQQNDAVSDATEADSSNGAGNKKIPSIDWEGLEKVKKLEWYAWDRKGMIAYKKGVPIEDVFIMRQDVIDLLTEKDHWVKLSEEKPTIEGYYKVRFDDGTEDEKPFRIRPTKNICGFMTEKKVDEWFKTKRQKNENIF